jgi:hypothetical protein
VLANDIDYVIGVDSALDVTASEAGYRRLLAVANRQAVGRRAWAVEGTGSYGSFNFIGQAGSPSWGSSC